MNDVDKLLLEVKDKINNEPIVQEYFRLKAILEKDEDILELEKQVRFHQKKMCENTSNDEIYFEEKKLYEGYLSKLENNPIYSNFILIKNEVNAFLLDIRDILG